MTLLDIDAAKRALKKDQLSDEDLDELEVYVEAVCALVDELCGPSSPQTFTQTFGAATSRSGSWYLDEPRVLSVLSVTSPVGAVAPAGFVADPEAGTVRLLTASGAVTYTVTYTAGRTTVPAPLRLAARAILKTAWSDRRGSGSRQAGGVDPDGGGITVSSDLVKALGIIPPKRALLMMAPYLKDSDGFA